MRIPNIFQPFLGHTDDELVAYRKESLSHPLERLCIPSVMRSTQMVLPATFRVLSFALENVIDVAVSPCTHHQSVAGKLRWSELCANEAKVRGSVPMWATQLLSHSCPQTTPNTGHLSQKCMPMVRRRSHVKGLDKLLKIYRDSGKSKPLEVPGG